MHPSEPFPHFVDDVLAYLHEVFPTLATLDGVHQHDDHLEDLSRSALEAHARALSGFSRRLHQIEQAHLAPAQRVDHEVLRHRIEARLYEVEELRPWDRNPHTYAELVGTSLAAQTAFPYASEVDRARRVLSRLRQIPRLTLAARDNVKECPGIFAKVGLESWRSVLRFIAKDIPRALSTLDDLHLLSDLADASSEAERAIAGYIDYLETDLAPRARASFRLGRERFERRLLLEEGIALGPERLLTIALRELTHTQEAFREAVSELGSGDTADRWRQTKDERRAGGSLVAEAKTAVTELERFLRRQTLVTMLDAELPAVTASPEFFRSSAGTAWAPGPLESKPARAHYYVTEVDASWSADRRAEHARDLCAPALLNLSVREVCPGNLLYRQQLRRVESKVRKSLVLASTSVLGGWAHYGEQAMVEAGFQRQDPGFRVAQLAEALVRLARVVVGVRLHCEDLSVEQGMRFFRDEAFLEETTARREAERGTFDPMYVVDAVGKLMLLRLRADYKAREGSAYTVRAFHDAFLSQGAIPFWAHRRLLLGDAASDLTPAAGLSTSVLVD